MSDVQYLQLNKVRNCRISKEKAYNPPMNEVSAYGPEGSRNPSPTVSANSTLSPRISRKGLLRFWVSISCSVWNCFPQRTSFPPPGGLWSLQKEVYKLGNRIYPSFYFIVYVPLNFIRLCCGKFRCVLRRSSRRSSRRSRSPWLVAQGLAVWGSNLHSGTLQTFQIYGD